MIDIDRHRDVKDVTAESIKHLHAGPCTRKLVKNANLNGTWLGEQIGNKEREQIGKCVTYRKERSETCESPQS